MRYFLYIAEIELEAWFCAHHVGSYGTVMIFKTLTAMFIRNDTRNNYWIVYENI